MLKNLKKTLYASGLLGILIIGAILIFVIDVRQTHSIASYVGGTPLSVGVLSKGTVYTNEVLPKDELLVPVLEACKTKDGQLRWVDTNTTPANESGYKINFTVKRTANESVVVSQMVGSNATTTTIPDFDGKLSSVQILPFYRVSNSGNETEADSYYFSVDSTYTTEITDCK